MFKRIVEINDSRHRGKLDIVFDDNTSINATKSFVKKSGIAPGQNVDAEGLTRSADEDEFNKCYEAALNYLEYRPRSEGELRSHLVFKRNFSAGCVSQAIVRLKRSGLLNDRAFVELWIRERIANRPKSRRMIMRELLQKGVKTDTINDCLATVSDDESALKAGLKKAKTLASFEYTEFAKRMTSFLARRGYGSETVNSTVARLWEKITK